MPRGIFNPTLIVFVLFEDNMSNFVQNSKVSLWTMKILIIQKIFLIISNGMLLLFNILPTQIKSLSDEPRLFKKKLKSFLLQHAFYSLYEFYQVICEWQGCMYVCMYVCIDVCV